MTRGVAHTSIIAGFVPAILLGGWEKDGRDKPGHDDDVVVSGE